MWLICNGPYSPCTTCLQFLQLDCDTRPLGSFWSSLWVFHVCRLLLKAEVPHVIRDPWSGWCPYRLNQGPAAHHPMHCCYRGMKQSRGNEWDVCGGRRAEGQLCIYIYIYIFLKKTLENTHTRGLRAQRIRRTVSGTRAINDPWMLSFLNTQEMKVVFEVAHRLQRAVRLKALYCKQMF